MGWTKTDVKGRVMWEDSSGTRVSSHEEISAIESARKLPEQEKYPAWFDYEEEEVESVHPAIALTILIAIIAVMVSMMISQ